MYTALSDDASPARWAINILIEYSFLLPPQAVVITHCTQLYIHTLDKKKNKITIFATLLVLVTISNHYYKNKDIRESLN